MYIDACVYMYICVYIYIYIYGYIYLHIWGFPPGILAGRESICIAGDFSLFPGLERFPGVGRGNLLQYSCLEISHGQRSLKDCSPWSCTESDTLKRNSQANKGWNLSTWNNMNESRVYYSKLSKWKTNTVWNDCTHMWNLKNQNKWTNLTKYKVREKKQVVDGWEGIEQRKTDEGD